MTKRSGYVRVKSRTHIAINMIAAEMQMKTGKSHSADTAIWDLIQKVRADIAALAAAKAKESEQEDDNDEQE